MINNFFLLAATLFLQFHDFHVSHTTFHYNNKTKSMEITIRVALKDLEKSIENKYSKKFNDFLDNQKNISLETRIVEYFENNLTLSVNNHILRYHWVGKELSNNLHDIFLYFEIPNYDKKENLGTITIQNSLFLELYNNQTNIVLINIIDNKYNLTFTSDNSVQTIFMDNKSW